MLTAWCMRCPCQGPAALPAAGMSAAGACRGASPCEETLLSKINSGCPETEPPQQCSATADAPPAAPDEQHRQSEARVRRLKVLVQLRRLYRNLIRGQCLLDYPSPVYSQTGGPP
jgi:hypothetical protein